MVEPCITGKDCRCPCTWHGQKCPCVKKCGQEEKPIIELIP